MSSLLLLALVSAATAALPAASGEPLEATVVTVTASATASGDALRRRDRSLERLATIRTASGAGTLAPSELLALSAARHADYLSANGLRSTTSLHTEAAGLAGFSGADPYARMRAAGVPWSYATEVIGAAAGGGDCVDALMDTVYHAALLLSRVTQVGLAYGTEAAARACVIDLAAPPDASDAPVPASGRLVRYPWPGMTLATGTFRPAQENPRPAPGLLAAATAGAPVLVGLRDAVDRARNADATPIEIQQFELRDDRNASIPCVILADTSISGPAIVADKTLHGVFVVLVPRVPLSPGHYRVFLHATSANGRAIAPAPWDFTVAAP